VVQLGQGLRLHPAADGSKDVFVHISAVERAGLETLREGQKVSFDLATERGKTAAVNIKSA
jgi:CspA family cold shock protein